MAKGTQATVNQWGNGLAVRLTKSVARAAGLQEGSVVHIVASPGKVVVQAVDRPLTLAQMLASYDPNRHSGETMDFPAVGREFPL